MEEEDVEEGLRGMGVSWRGMLVRGGVPGVGVRVGGWEVLVWTLLR